MSCYISQRDLTLTLSIDLQGARISYADGECLRPHSFKIFHPDSGQCLFLAAEDNGDLLKWFSDITKNSKEVISENSSTTNGPFVSYFEFCTDTKSSVTVTQPLSERAAGFSNASHNAASGQLDGKSQHKGVLMKASHTGKWKKRCCTVDDGVLHISRSYGDKVPIITLPLESCSLELLSHSSSTQFSCQFKLKPFKSEKTHTFAALTEAELYGWISALRRASFKKRIPSEIAEDSVSHKNMVSHLFNFIFVVFLFPSFHLS